MTEFEKKQSGQFYDARDTELRNQQNKAKNLMRKYNSLPPDDMENRGKALSEMFGYIGKNTRVNQPVYIDYGYNISIGDNCIVNMNCTFLDTGEIRIGKNTLIGPDVKIYTATHALDINERFLHEADGTMAIKTRTEPVSIGDNTWIGGGTIVLPGVNIGSNVIIGAGSVVTKSIPDGVIACGNPCEVKREINNDEK